MNLLNSLFDWVLGSGLRASLLVLAVLAAQWLAKNRLPSRWRYALWLPVLVALLVPALPMLPSWMNWPTGRVNAELLREPAPSAPANAARTAVVLPESVAPSEIPTMGQRIDATTSAAAARVQPAPATKPVNWRAWLVPAWLIGATGASLFVLVSFGLTMWRIRRQLHSVETELLARITRIAESVGLRGAPRILQSAAVASPAVCGVWRPTLLLNEGFPKHLSDDESDMVLRHELTHIRRGDLIVNALLCALLALHWFNPLLWLAFFRVRADREAACDAQVLDGAPPQRRAAYGHTLLKMETGFPPTGLCLGFVGILQRGGTLRERIHAIISQPKPNLTMKTITALSIIALAIAGIAKAAEKESEPKMEKVSVAEFRKQYANSKIEHSVHQITYLGHKDGKASIRVRSMINASSLLPGKGRWSERIIYVHLQDLDPEFRAELEKPVTSPKANDPDKLKDQAAPAKEGASRVKPQPVDLEEIKEKVSVRFGADTVASLRREGDRLLPRAPGEKAEATDVVVKSTLKETTATPVPVQGNPARSYLEMSHGFDKPLHFRALSRLKGSKDFYEVEGPLEPVEPGDQSLVRCWESGTLVEQVILFDFRPVVAESLTEKPPGTLHTVDGKQAGRTAAITKQLSRAGILPGPLRDVHFVEEQTGDGILGPSDFAAFYAFTVAPADLPAWRAALTKSAGDWNRFSNDSDIKHASPKKPQLWWVSPAELSKLEFYSPKSLTGRSNGWVGIAPDGRIFIYAFTM